MPIRVWLDKEVSGTASFIFLKISCILPTYRNSKHFNEMQTHVNTHKHKLLLPKNGTAY